MNYVPVVQKCVAELDQTEPRLDYIRGMLDTLLSLNTIDITPISMPHFQPGMATVPANVELDEGQVLDAKTQAMLGQIDTTIRHE